jgi:hypothetical protein
VPNWSLSAGPHTGRAAVFVWCSASFPHRVAHRRFFGPAARPSWRDLTTPTGRRVDTVPRLRESGCRERRRPTRRALNPAIRSCIRRALACAPSRPSPRRRSSRRACRRADPFLGRRRYRHHVRATRSFEQASGCPMFTMSNMDAETSRYVPYLGHHRLTSKSVFRGTSGHTANSVHCPGSGRRPRYCT